MLYQELAIFILGLIVLIKSSNVFVEYASIIAKRLGVKEIVIGLTLVALGTSLPELVSSVAAAFANDTELVIGNIVGSNIANIGLILGVTIIYSTLKIKPSLYKKEFGLLISVTILFFLFALDGTISSVEGLVMLIILFSYLTSLLHYKMQLGRLFKLQSYLNLIVHIRGILPWTKKDHQQKVSIKKVVKPKKEVKSRIQQYMFFDIFMLMFAGIFIFYSAQYIVEAATSIAISLAIGSNIVGLTLFAIGTSLPELSVSITAVRKKLNGLVVGNIIGSNIANILMVGGISAIIRPLHVLKFSIVYSIPVMLAMSLLLLTFSRSEWKLTKKEGIVLLIFYILFLIGTVYTAFWYGFLTLVNNSVF